MIIAKALLNCGVRWNKPINNKKEVKRLCGIHEKDAFACSCVSVCVWCVCICGSVCPHSEETSEDSTSGDLYTAMHEPCMTAFLFPFFSPSCPIVHAFSLGWDKCPHDVLLGCLSKQSNRPALGQNRIKRGTCCLGCWHRHTPRLRHHRRDVGLLD